MGEKETEHNMVDYTVRQENVQQTRDGQHPLLPTNCSSVLQVTTVYQRHSSLLYTNHCTVTIFIPAPEPLPILLLVTAHESPSDFWFPIRDMHKALEASVSSCFFQHQILPQSKIRSRKPQLTRTETLSCLLRCQKYFTYVVTMMVFCYKTKLA